MADRITEGPLDIEVTCRFRAFNRSDWRDILNALGGLGAADMEITGVPDDWQPHAY